ncbi:hypothetical protein JCM33374_g6606 [Metschnikowia sp. JCM 33374]|nr:hypothetical protein JCM33374_g6606 [Metschnikowia sp. JCM 33374]
MKKRSTLKGQPSISSFFSPKPSPKADVSPATSIDEGPETKRMLKDASSSPSKKPRTEGPKNGGIRVSGGPQNAVKSPKTFPQPPKSPKQSFWMIWMPKMQKQRTQKIRPALLPRKTPISMKLGPYPQKASEKAPKKAPKTAPKKPPKSKSPALKLTPLEQQYKDLKAAHLDKVLAIQVGYKFKFFGNDAVIASQLLNIMLIPGNLSLDERTHDRYAYCSIPDTRLHIHLQRLLNHGLKVGVVKQTETAAVKSVESSNKSSLFERRITAVYTRATYMGDEAASSGYSADLPPPEADRYIMCIDDSRYPEESAFVAVQPATGDILYDVFSDTLAREQLETRLAYLNPSEVIVIGSGTGISKEVRVALKLQNPAASVNFVQQKAPETVHLALEDFFRDLDAGGKYAHLCEYFCLNYACSVQSCIAELVAYLAEFNLSNVFTITSNFSSFTESGRYMVLPATTLRALDIFEVHDDPTSKQGSLYWLMNHTKTRKGASMLRSWIGKPLVNKADIEKRLDAVASLASGEFVHVIDSFKAILAKIGKSGVDLDKLLIKIHYSATYNTEKITRKELFLMLRCYIDVLQSLLKASTSQVVDSTLAQINVSAAYNDKDVTEQKTKFFVHENNPKYDAITHEFEKIAEIERDLDDELHAIRHLLKRPQLAYVTNMKETHLIEVRNGKQVDALPSDWLRISGTKTVSRFRTPTAASLHKQLQYHNDKLVKESDKCFNQFLQEIDSEYEYFREIVHNISLFDCLISLSTIAQDDGNVRYVKPKLVDEQVVNIRQGCHPILSNLPQNLGAYVPNDVSLSYDENRVLIITGPNMGGKSSLVKQIALFVMMAQVGSFLPCSEATLGIFDSIYIRMGASDNILRGKSTFMVEMSECASIIKNYTCKSLIILDEIGRGTGTSDGIALAYSILKYIIEDKKAPLTLFITHYPSLHVLEREHDAVKNHHMAFVEKHSQHGDEKEWPEVVFLYKLVAGVVSNSYGLNVAKLAGIDKTVIDAAHKMSESMKSDVERGVVLRALSQMTPETAFDVLSNLF